MVIYGGSNEQVDLHSPRKDVCSVGKALDECFVFHLGGVVGGKEGGGEKGEGLWIRVPGNCGLGQRVGASGTCLNKSLLIFGGCRGLEDAEKTQLKDARHVSVDRLLELNVVGEKAKEKGGKELKKKGESLRG